MMKKKHFLNNVKIHRGFTMTELITVIVLVGILSVTVLPRFYNQGDFSSRGFYDQAAAAIRYAQKVAIAQRRFVCVNITGGNTLTLTQGAALPCVNNLANPNGGVSYVITAPNDVTIDNVSFSFNALGVPSAAQSITVSGVGLQIEVGAGTGYVYEKVTP